MLLLATKNCSKTSVSTRYLNIKKLIKLGYIILKPIIAFFVINHCANLGLLVFSVIEISFRKELHNISITAKIL